jgi:hypothetical protein
LRPLPFKFGEINFHVVEAFSSEYAYLYFIASLSNLTRLGERPQIVHSTVDYLIFLKKSTKIEFCRFSTIFSDFLIIFFYKFVYSC